MNRKTTKRALGLSFVSLLLCVTMLMGSTFAWFTDNATVAVNTIQAGNLDIKLLAAENADAKDLEGQILTFADKNGKTDILFEPGAKFNLQQVWLYNAGNLHAKYKVVISGVDGNEELAQVLDVYVNDTPVGKTLFELVNEGGVVKENNIAPKQFDTFGTVALKMQESAGNEYQGKTIEGIAITVYATQAAEEYDSEGNTYDKDAQYDDEGASAEVPSVVTAAQLKEVLNDFADAGSGSNKLNITSNLVLAAGETWTPITVDGYNGADVITVEGNGKTISGLNAPLFAGGFAGGSGIIIKDLTIADSTIVSTNTLGSGAFIETVDSMDVITLENCHVKNSTITGSRTGGLIGWNSGYNNENDGPVKTYVTIENCSVTECEITGAGTVGGIVGHAGANAWTYNTIDNCKVENCKLTSNDDSYRVGAIVGTANVGEVTIIGCTSTGNTIKQNNNGTEIVRPEGQSELYGRTSLGETGKLTIDGVEIK